MKLKSLIKSLFEDDSDKKKKSGESNQDNTSSEPDSQAARDAKAKGLEAMPFGRFGKNGVATHQSRDGKLVPLANAEKPEPKPFKGGRTPKEKPEMDRYAKYNPSPADPSQAHKASQDVEHSANKYLQMAGGNPEDAIALAQDDLGFAQSSASPDKGQFIKQVIQHLRTKGSSTLKKPETQPDMEKMPSMTQMMGQDKAAGDKQVVSAIANNAIEQVGGDIHKAAAEVAQALNDPRFQGDRQYLEMLNNELQGRIKAQAGNPADLQNVHPGAQGVVDHFTAKYGDTAAEQLGKTIAGLKNNVESLKRMGVGRSTQRFKRVVDDVKRHTDALNMIQGQAAKPVAGPNIDRTPAPNVASPVKQQISQKFMSGLSGTGHDKALADLMKNPHINGDVMKLADFINREKAAKPNDPQIKALGDRIAHLLRIAKETDAMPKMSDMAPKGIDRQGIIDKLSSVRGQGDTRGISHPDNTTPSEESELASKLMDLGDYEMSPDQEEAWAKLSNMLMNGSTETNDPDFKKALLLLARSIEEDQHDAQREPEPGEDSYHHFGPDQ